MSILEATSTPTLEATSTRTPSQVAREAFHGLYDERDLSDPSRYWTDESVDDFLTLGIRVRGKEDLARFFRKLFAAFPDWKVDIEQTVDDGDSRAVVQWTGHGTFSGGERWRRLEPTGSEVTVRGIEIMSFDRAGKVEQNTVYYDGEAFARQIGMLPREGSMTERALLATFNAVTRIKRRLHKRRL